MHLGKFLFPLLSFVCFSSGTPPLQIEKERGFLSIRPQNEKEDLSAFDISPRYRLPNSIIPKHYDVQLKPVLDEIENEERFTAPGHVSIDIECLTNTMEIILQRNGPIINNDSVRVTHTSGEEIVIKGFSLDLELHFFRILLSEELQEGEFYNIQMEFKAPIVTDPDQALWDGLYRGHYIDPISGDTKYLMASHFQPHRARKAFPCFDEPHLKTTFDIKILRRENYTSNANTHLISSSPPDENGWITDTFDRTVLMPVYLIAFLVSDFKNSTDEETFGKPVSTLAAPHLIDRGDGDYAAKHAAMLLKHFQESYLQEYPLSKMDSSALPQFRPGAMENYGLNHYRENYLLYNKEETLESSRFTVTSILAHELAHQWFGNLVTCGWWSDLWLNEGFATFVSYLGVKAVAPEFEAEIIIMNDAFQYSMQFDAEDSAPSVTMPDVLTPVEVSSMFNRQSYEKGASLIRMMEAFLGEATFQKGLQRYLEAMKYNAAFQDDLFHHLNLQAQEDGVLEGMTIKEIMDTWTLQKGFPLIRISRGSSMNEIYITQEKFTNYVPRRERALNPNELWNVPIAIATQQTPTFANHTPKIWLNKTVALKSAEQDISGWIFVNPDATGYYRVLYDAHLTDLLLKQLKEDPSIISEISRSQLLDDYFNSAWQRYIQIETALDLTVLLESEITIVVWDTFFTNMRKSFTMFSNKGFIYLRNHFMGIIENALNAIGVEEKVDDKGSILLLRSQLLDWVCAFDSPICKNYTNSLFDQWESDPTTNPIPLNQQAVIYCAGVAARGFQTYDFIFNLYKTETVIGQKSRLLNSLACSNEISLLAQMLEDALDENNGFPRVDAITAIQRVGMNSIGRALTLRYLRNNITKLHDIDNNLIPSVISTLTSYWNTPQEKTDLETFIAEAETAELPEEILSRLRNSIGMVDANILWMDEFFEPMKLWFEKN